MLLDLREALQLLDRLGVPGHLADDGLELIDGAGRVAQLVAEQAGEGDAEGRGLLAVVGGLGAAQVGSRQVLVLASSVQQLGEGVEGLAVVVHHVEGGAVGLCGLLGAPTNDALQARDRVERVEAILIGAGTRAAR